MDNVHKSDKKSWISKPLKLQDMLKEIRDDPVIQLLNSHDTVEDSCKALFPDLELDFKELEAAVSFDALKSKQESRVQIAQSFDIPEMKRLETLESQKADVDLRNNKRAYHKKVLNDLRNVIYPYSEPSPKLHQEVSSDLMKLPELLLTVQIYHPVTSVSSYQASKIVLDQEILVIGQHFLTVLRDFIKCTSDMVIPGDLSENPTASSLMTCKDLYKSGFFYINDTFYNDFRSSDANDYSKDIIEWAKEKGRGVGPFSSCSMEETRFIDLTIQLGYPYVYCHQGDCEHILVFSDVRALDKDDDLYCNAYPRMSRYIPKRRTVCMMCFTQTASWLITKHLHLPDPIYLVCQLCFEGFFYTKDKKKIGEFEAKMFVDQSTVV